jgi:hypothetical protein
MLIDIDTWATLSALSLRVFSEDVLPVRLARSSRRCPSSSTGFTSSKLQYCHWHGILVHFLSARGIRPRRLQLDIEDIEWNQIWSSRRAVKCRENLPTTQHASSTRRIV